MMMRFFDEKSPALPLRDIHPLEYKASIQLLHLKDGPSLMMMMMILMMMRMMMMMVMMMIISVMIEIVTIMMTILRVPC